MVEAKSVLPVKNNVPTVGIPQYIKMIIEGPSKVGKTTFMASWPGAVLIEAEPGGAAHVSCPVLDISKGQDPLRGLRMAIEELRTDKKYQTVCLDTIDAVADLISKEICKKLNIETISDAPKSQRHGVQWEKYKNEVTGIVGALLALPKNVIVSGHTKPATYDGEGDKRVMRNPEGLDIYGSAARILYARVDNIAHMSVVNVGGITQTMLSFKSGMDCTRGSRHPALRDKEIILPRANGYSTFEQLFKEGK